jgi:hypothetical protein
VTWYRSNNGWQSRHHEAKASARNSFDSSPQRAIANS